MANPFFNGFDVVRIDADGVIIPMPAATLDINSGTLGTVTTDEYGNIAAAELPGTAVGDVVEFILSGYPNSFFRTVANTENETFALKENYACTFVVENLAPAREPVAAEIIVRDMDDPNSRDIRLGYAPMNATTSFKHENLSPRNFRSFTNYVTETMERQHLIYEDAQYHDLAAASSIAGVTGAFVTSVALSMPSIFSVSGSPVTSTGTLTATLATQTANRVFAGPTSGGAATPAFRTLVVADMPSLASGWTGVLPVANGGTGISSLGSGVATWLGTPTSANLRTMVNTAGSVTGTAGSLVFSTAPTFTTSIDFSADTGIYKINGVNVVRMKGSNNYYFGPGGSPNAGNNNLVMGTGGGGMTSSATSNVFVGFLAGNSVTDGSDNLFLGIYAGWNVTTGSSNTFFGSSAGGSVNTANFNAAFGRESLQQNQKSYYNTAMGYRAGNSLTNSSTIDGLNVFVGALCSNSGVTTGVKNTFIGAQINAGSNVSNHIIIGDGDGTHRLVVNSSGNVGIGTPLTGSIPIAARLHVASTTAPQYRLGYDVNNYLDISISNAGAVTLDAVGSSAGFTFSDKVSFPGGARFAGYTSSVNAPSTTELPNDKDFCIHEETDVPNFWFAFNRGGTIYKVPLT